MYQEEVSRELHESKQCPAPLPWFARCFECASHAIRVQFESLDTAHMISYREGHTGLVLNQREKCVFSPSQTTSACTAEFCYQCPDVEILLATENFDLCTFLLYH